MSPPDRATDRLRPWLVIAGVVILAVASLLAAFYNERQHLEQARASARVQAQILADTVTAALSFGDLPALREYVGAIRANPDIDAAGVYDEHGDLLASFTRSQLASRLADAMSPATAPGRIIILTPVVQDHVKLGTVYLRDRGEPLPRRLGRYAPPGFLLLMGTLVLLVMTMDSQALRRANKALQTQIAQREKAEAALRQSQKMEAIGRLTGGIAHDFNNMLAIVLGSLDLLLRRYAGADPRMLRFVREARDGASRAAVLTQRLLAFSRLQPLKPTSADVVKIIDEIVPLIRRTLGESISVTVKSSGGLWPAHIDVAELETAIVNLAINSRDAMPGGGTLAIEAGNAYVDKADAEAEPDITPGEYVTIGVSDTGCGIRPDLLTQVFEPFFTTKPPGQGTGLGLSQVLGFIKQSGGHVRLQSEAGVGTTVRLYLPRSFTEAEASPPQTSTAAAKARRDQTILVVEDEPGVRAFAIEALAELGYAVVSADRPSVALRLLDDRRDITLMLTDVVMPEMNGQVLAEQARARRPSIRVVFMTGYTRDDIVHHGHVDPGARLVSKPFTVSQLGAELEAALAH
jgi:signal transduction histidine kinase/CheY-like chemotaxis protein